MMAERRRRADKRTAVAVGLIVLMFCVGLYRGEENRKAADRKIAAAAVERVGQINASRREVLIRSCREQNMHHDDTVRQLDKRIASLPAGARRQRAKQSRAFTLALIGSLAPKRHCIRRANRLIR